MATLGTTSTPATGNHTTNPNSLVVSGPYTMPEAGTATKVSMFIRNTSGVALGQRCGIYADNAGVPGALVAMSADTTVVDGTGSPNGVWVDFTVSAALTSGAKYWIAYWSNAVGGSNIDLYYNTSGPGTYSRTLAYSTTGAPPDPFGSGSAGSNEYAIYITYTPGGGSTFTKTVSASQAQTATLPRQTAKVLVS